MPVSIDKMEIKKTANHSKQNANHKHHHSKNLIQSYTHLQITTVLNALSANLYLYLNFHVSFFNS